jgi:hypothetical protein
LGTIIISILSIIVTYIAPIAALILSIVSLAKSNKSQGLQTRIHEIELKLKQHDLEELEKSKSAKAAACIEARIIPIVEHKYKLKVWNSGNLPAFKINVKFDRQIGVSFDQILPFEILEPNDSFDQDMLILPSQTPKVTITTIWEDEYGNTFTKDQLRSF